MEAAKPLVNNAPQMVDLSTGHLKGRNVSASEKKLGQLKNLFADEPLRSTKDQQEIIYKVEVHEPVERGTEGGLLFGTTFLNAGKVGNEYYFTQGHFHKTVNRTEYYWGIQGRGILLLMNRQRQCTAEIMSQGSLHFIPADTAHRVINTGNEVLSFGACWPADAGYDYDEILANGFSVRVFEVDGQAVLTKSGI